MPSTYLIHRLLAVLVVLNVGEMAAQGDRSTASTPNAAQLAAQLDSLSKSQKQTDAGLNEAIETLKDLKRRALTPKWLRIMIASNLSRKSPTNCSGFSLSSEPLAVLLV